MGEPRATARYLTPGPVHRRLGLVCLGVGSADGPVAPVRARTLSSHAAVLVDRGAGRFRDALAGARPVTAPAIVWLRPGVEHGYGPDDGGWSHHWTLFDGPATAAYAELGYLPADPVTALSDAEPVRRAFARLAEAAASPDDPHVPAAAALHDLLVTVRRHGPVPTDSPLLRALREGAAERMTVAERALALGVSAEALRRAVHRVSGLGPAEYLVLIRLALAKDLLAGTDLPIAAVARRVGYDDAGYFTRLFTRRAGLAPSAFREQQRRDEPSLTGVFRRRGRGGPGRAAPRR